MMTGRRVMEHLAGVGGTRYLPGRYPTIAEEMRKQGYATGGFIANVYWTGRHTGLNRGFIHYDDFFGTPMDGISRTVLGRAVTYELLPRFGMIDIPGRKNAEQVNRELLDWIPKGGRPFFAFVNYFDVHAPYFPPEGFAGKVSPVLESRRPSKIEIGAWNEHGHLPNDSTLAAWRDRYDESIMYLDHQIGVLIDSLEARGILKNTLVIVTADHGEAFGEHRMVHHGGSLYLDQIRVPLILRQPGRIRGGVQITQPVDLRSLAPTIMEAATGNRGKFQSSSLLAVSDSTESAVALSEGPKVNGNPREWPTGRSDVQAVVMGHFHLIVMKDGERELYDFAADPAELHNLANEPSAGGTMALMTARMAESFPPPRTRPPRSGSR
jgi:arylsulfatase A-like enzyme